MRYYQPKSNKQLVGRVAEKKLLAQIMSRSEGSIIVMHGRRRVGKTELIEQTFRERNLLKFEGKQNQAVEVQRQSFLEMIACYFEDHSLANLQANNWRSVLELLARRVQEGVFTIFLEEFQWMCCYDPELISELKYYWDNHFRHNPNLILVLCGSSPSFMIKEVVYSKALHNRSQFEIQLKQFSLAETQQFLGERFSYEEVMRAYLAIGGIPEYLKYIHDQKATLPGLVKNSFLPNSFFSTEKKRVFVSALSESKSYETLIEILASLKYADRSTLLKALDKEGGGSISKIIEDLVLCGFISVYQSFDSGRDSANKRYQISDNYLQFYFKFIKPLSDQIANGDFADNPNRALTMTLFEQWLGYAFERYCQNHAYQIATILNFGSIKYKASPYFRRGRKEKLEDARNYQLDLVFERSDRVYTICEIKNTITPVTVTQARDTIAKFELAKFKKKYAVQRVLISTQGATEEVHNAGYFDRIIGLEEFFT
jgi:hypothetical protein